VCMIVARNERVNMGLTHASEKGQKLNLA